MTTKLNVWVCRGCSVPCVLHCADIMSGPHHCPHTGVKCCWDRGILKDGKVSIDDWDNWSYTFENGL